MKTIVLTCVLLAFGSVIVFADCGCGGPGCDCATTSKANCSGVAKAGCSGRAAKCGGTRRAERKAKRQAKCSG